MKLSDEKKTFILNWGEKLSHWGLNRTEAQIYTLLFLSEQSLTMEEIAESLNVARSNVTNSLKELQSWKIVKRVHVMGDRRKHFECIKDVWTLFRQVVQEQKRREIDPMIEILDETQSALKKHPRKENEYMSRKVDEMMGFFDITTAWYGRLDKMSSSTFKKYVKLANTIDKVLNKLDSK